MKKILIFSAVISFASGYYINQKLNDTKCLVQNISLDQPLSIVSHHDCSVTNVRFDTVGLSALEIK